MHVDPYEETITLPRAVRFPVELVPPAGFDPERLETWPAVAGRLEHVDGRLLYMPPSGDEQQDTATDVVITLGAWVRSRPDYVLGSNEAGMRLGGATRAADAAIWRRSDLGQYTGGLRRVAPVLAVEVVGRDDTEEQLVEKAAWYRRVGVAVVWIVLPATFEVRVIAEGLDERVGRDGSLPAHAALPGLAPAARELFHQRLAPR